MRDLARGKLVTENGNPPRQQTAATMTPPRVILGCMTFGPEGTSNARVTTVDGTKEMFATFKSHGHSELDTARSYNDGKQESYTRQAGGMKGGFQVATKVHPGEGGNHKPAKLREMFLTSLSELGAESVELLYLHAPDRTVPIEETAEEMNKLYKEGKFKVFGISNFAAWEVARLVEICIAKGYVRPRVYQAMYNALTRSLEEELLPCCRHYGIDIVVYNPLAGGILSGRYKSLDVPDAGRFSNAPGNKQAGENYRKRYFNSIYLEALAKLEPVLNRHNLTMVETALRWVVHHSKLRVFDGDGIIIGASSSQQLEANLKDFEKGKLPEEVVEALGDAWASVKVVAPKYWR